MDERPLPVSCNNLAINLAGLLGLLLCCTWIYVDQSIPTTVATLLCLMATALPIVVLELLFSRTYQRPSTGLDLSRPRRLDTGRITVKLVGLCATLAILALLYWLFPHYEEKFYNRFHNLIGYVLPFLPLLIVASIPYFVFVDRRMIDPKDGYWFAGLAVLGRWREVDPLILKQYVLGWLVKGFFVPIMFCYMAKSIGHLRSADLATLWQYPEYYSFFYSFIFLIDLAFTNIGYLLTFRLFDSHMRTTDPTLRGWFVTLICYYPIWGFFYSKYFPYDDGVFWGGWFADMPHLRVAWGILILIIVGFHVFGTVHFGIRFSNLTNRGILTNGLFRFTKHPQYVTKNISWWLISVPFLSLGSPVDAGKHCLMLLMVNFIYFQRARTEERHLSMDPVYVRYALAMNERSIFRGIARRFPYLVYRPPEESRDRVEYGRRFFSRRRRA